MRNHILLNIDIQSNQILIFLQVICLRGGYLCIHICQNNLRFSYNKISNFEYPFTPDMLLSHYVAVQQPSSSIFRPCKNRTLLYSLPTQLPYREPLPSCCPDSHISHEYPGGETTSPFIYYFFSLLFSYACCMLN